MGVHDVGNDDPQSKFAAIPYALLAPHGFSYGIGLGKSARLVVDFAIR